MISGFPDAGAPALVLALGLAASALAQAPRGAPPPDDRRPPGEGWRDVGGPPPLGGPPRFGPGGFGPRGMGGVREDRKLVADFDRDGDHRLNGEERKAAREFLNRENAEGRGPRQRGPRGGFGRGADLPPPEPGPRLSPSDARAFPDTPLYDLATLRTLFLEFENAGWERELGDFYSTDVEVPAKLTVDGRTLSDVGVHFRGASSYFTVGEGRKRSLNLSLDFVHRDQELGGYRTLNLLNSHADASYLRTVLYHHIAAQYGLPTPRANFVRVVINGESWGIYVNAQQFNKDLVKDWFGTTKGARWKVPGSPRGRGNLAYLGEDLAEYRRHYEIKTRDDEISWAALLKLCKVLNETPADQLETALEPLLDLDGALKFLAIENVLINNDGYWIRTSDYHLYRDEAGRFHLIPHDANETFREPGGPGFGNRPRVSGLALDPLTGAEDPDKPLLNKLLAVPSLKRLYLGYVRDIAEQWLDWERIGPLAQQCQALIAEDVKRDTRKLDSFEAFTRSLTEDTEEQGFRGPQRGISLKRFVEERRAFLLNHPEVRNAPLPTRPPQPGSEPEKVAE